MQFAVNNHFQLKSHIKSPKTPRFMKFLENWRPFLFNAIAARSLPDAQYTSPKGKFTTNVCSWRADFNSVSRRKQGLISKIILISNQMALINHSNVLVLVKCWAHWRCLQGKNFDCGSINLNLNKVYKRTVNSWLSGDHGWLVPWIIRIMAENEQSISHEKVQKRVFDSGELY